MISNSVTLHLKYRKKNMFLQPNIFISYLLLFCYSLMLPKYCFYKLFNEIISNLSLKKLLPKL